MTSPPEPESVWGCADYAPTARRLAPASAIVADRVAREVGPDALVADIGAGHGHTTDALLSRGLRVVAVEPEARMAEIGRRRVPGADWLATTGEVTGLPDDAVAGVASAFGTMFCDPHAGPAEWARVLRPGGTLVMTAWDQRGFLAEMTDRMTAVLDPAATTTPAHMRWGVDDSVRTLLGAHFTDVTVEHRDLEWGFGDVDAGMELYLHGSPTHTWAMAHAGERRAALLEALRQHLVDSADADGTIRAYAGYALIVARAR